MNAQGPEAAVAAWLATQQDAMIALLRDMVDIDSGSYDKTCIDAVGAVAERFLRQQGVPVEHLPQSKHGDCLRAVGRPFRQPRRQHRPDGHRDTVFPAGEAGRRPFAIRDGVAYGPGVAT